MSNIKNNITKTILSVLILILVFCSGEAFAAYSLPSSRSITWQGNVGVKGGIPARETIYQTITASSGDSTSSIQSALNNCPSGQVVLLGAGSFNVTSLRIPSNVTLRGAGVGQTTLKGTGTSSAYIVGFGQTGSLGTSVNLAGSYAKGSTTIATSTAHGWNPGDVILIDQLQNAAGDPPVSSTGKSGTCTWCSRESGTRPIGQVVKLIAPTSGTTATLEIPLYWNVDGTKTPQGTKVNIAATNAGIESLTIDNSSSWNSNQRSYGTIDIKYSDNCWVDKVEINGVWTNGIRLQAYYRITVSSSTIHLASAFTSSRGYAMSLGFAGSASLFENNAFYNLANGPQFEGPASGNVFAYNYATKMYSTDYTNAVRSGFGSHGAHSMMNLFEGNMSDGNYMDADGYWGTSSWNTFFRNRVTYDHTKSAGRFSIGIDTNNTYFNIVGNVLGSTGYEWVYETPYYPYEGSGNNAAIYVTGFSTQAYGNERSTMLRHANWDSVTAGQKWCNGSGEPGCQGGNTDQVLPDSLYLTSKPSWYCSESSYPAINPAGSTDALRYSKIPAQLRFEGGSCTVGDVNTNALTVASASGTVTSSPSGINCGSTCSANYDPATVVTLNAVENSGYTFTGWSGACSGTGTCVVTMDAAKSVTANYATTQFNLTVVKSGAGTGTVAGTDGLINCGNTCSVNYDSGKVVTLTASASGSTFAGWSGACSGTGACTVSMTEAKTVTATFIPVYSLTVTKSIAGAGAVASSDGTINCGSTCSAIYDPEATVILAASANSGYTFTGWLGACSGTGTCSVTMDAAKSVTAQFATAVNNLTVAKSGTATGTVTGSDGLINCGYTCSANYETGKSITLTARPVDTRATFSGWSGACTGTGTCTVSMTASKTAVATFNTKTRVRR